MKPNHDKALQRAQERLQPILAAIKEAKGDPRLIVWPNPSERRTKPRR